MPKSWSTRREARAQPFTQYDETGLQALLDSFEARMTKLNDMYLRLMGEHIADIGTLWPSDVHRLQQIRRMNKNLHDIERRIAEVAGQSREEIETLFQRIAQEDARMAGKILGARDTVNVKDNLPLQRILRAQARETAGRMTNLANSTALSGKYRDAVDVAVNAVQSGVEDYGSAIRRVIREAGQSGLRVRENGTRVVDYESGRSVRIDTAARMSVLDGVRHLNQSVMEEVGRQFGADGVEIDAHMLCAEDHVPYQGGQYSNEEFEQIQDSLQRPFGEWNCRHSWHPIMMGISPRTYSDDELSEMRRYSTEPIEIDGRTKTRYQWSQEMRRVETRIRQVKDTATLARYSGDDVLRRQCQQQIGILNERYTALAQGAGLKPEYQRTYVAGFRDAKAEMPRVSALTGRNNSTIIQEKEESPRKTGAKPFDVNWAVIQSREYAEKFKQLSDSETVSKAIHTRAVWALNNRTGKNTEELYAIDLKTGKEIASVLKQNIEFGIERTKSFSKKLQNADENRQEILLIHNHPRGLPPSIGDINALLNTKHASGITVGHDGSVYYYTRPNNEISRSDYNIAMHRYNKYSEATNIEKALIDLSSVYGFTIKKL